MSKELLELAERCEKATGPDGTLDAEIGRAVGGGVYGTLPEKLYPAYTASIDAAMLLVPEGFKLRGLAECDRTKGGTYWHAALVAFPTPPANPDPRKIGDASTAALAIVAAALRARSKVSE